MAGRLAAGADVETRLVDRESIPDAIIDGLGPGTLVGMSSHGRGGLARGVMGSVTEARLRMIDRSTLVIGPHAGRPGPFDGRVVAGIDGSPESEQAIEPARHWAEALDRPLWLIQVTDPTPTAASCSVTSSSPDTSRRLPGMRAALRTGTCSTPSRRRGRWPTSPRRRPIPSGCW